MTARSHSLARRFVGQAILEKDYTTPLEALAFVDGKQVSEDHILEAGKSSSSPKNRKTKSGPPRCIGHPNSGR